VVKPLSFMVFRSALTSWTCSISEAAGTVADLFPAYLVLVAGGGAHHRSLTLHLFHRDNPVPRPSAGGGTLLLSRLKQP
jgi:hypothetical protein